MALRRLARISAFALAALLCACGGGGGGGGDSGPPPVSGANAPAITTQPASLSVNVGDDATLSVNATGSGTLSYQWTRKGQDIPGATAASYVVPGVTMNDAGVYTVAVSNSEGKVASTSATLSVTSQLVAGSAEGYLQIRQLALADLDATLGAETGLTVTQESGPSMEIKLNDGNVIKYLSPAEQYADSSSTLKVTDSTGTKIWMVKLDWATRVGPALTRIQEADENGVAAAADSVTFTPVGIGSDGQVGPGTAAIAYQIANATGLDPTKMLISLTTKTASQDVTSLFTLNPSAGTLTLKPENLASLITSVQSAKVATLTFSLSTSDYNQTYGYEHVLTYAGGTLNVAVLNADQTPATDLAGSKFVARGFNTGKTAIATLDASGKLALSGLPADSYEVNQVLLSSSAQLTGFGTLPNSSSSVQLTITKLPPPTAVPQSNIPTARSLVVTGDDRQSAARVIDTKKEALAVKPLAAGAASAAYTATVASSLADTLITSPVTYSVPQGTQKVGVRIDVSTEEFPVYTGQKSQFNDLWLFNIQLPGSAGALQQSGKVNQSHATVGTITIEKCLDVSTVAKNAPAPITGQLGAQNVADSALSTTVTLTVSLTCENALNITEFKGSSKTSDGSPALFPKLSAKDESTPDGNIAGQYLSMPIKAKLPSSFGIPATLKFDPSDASITEIEILRRTSTGDVSLGKTYLSQATVAKAGLANFTGLRLEPTAQAPTSERIQLVAVLRGTLAGSTAPVESKPFPMTVDGSFTNFTPLFLASELAAYTSSKRFGTHDEAGGDAWVTTAMSTWLFGSSLRYNDTSAANIKQTSTGRSVLGHAGHSDGQQSDNRYWDGAGDFTDTLGGANKGKGIADLAAAAQAEIAANATSKPQLALLVSWIEQNRSNLNTYAGKTEVRRIYVGNAHVAQLLIDGQFPKTNSLVPGVTKWSGKSSKIIPQAMHLDHWHVNTVNP